MPQPNLFLGIDVGTGSARAGLFTADGRLLTSRDDDPPGITVWNPRTAEVLREIEGPPAHDVRMGVYGLGLALIWLGVTAVALSMTGLVPLWLTAVVIIRDLVIVSGGVMYQWLVEPVQPEPSVASKINTGIQLLYVLAVISHRTSGMPPPEFLTISGAAVFVTSTVSGLDYVVRWSGRAIRLRG